MARLDFFEIVRIDGVNAPEEVRGKTSYICGQGEVDGAPGVFVHNLKGVWCLEIEDCISLTRIDQAAADHSA